MLFKVVDCLLVMPDDRVRLMAVKAELVDVSEVVDLSEDAGEMQTKLENLGAGEMVTNLQKFDGQDIDSESCEEECDEDSSDNFSTDAQLSDNELARALSVPELESQVKIEPSPAKKPRTAVKSAPPRRIKPRPLFVAEPVEAPAEIPVVSNAASAAFVPPSAKVSAIPTFCSAVPRPPRTPPPALNYWKQVPWSSEPCAPPPLAASSSSVGPDDDTPPWRRNRPKCKSWSSSEVVHNDCYAPASCSKSSTPAPPPVAPKAFVETADVNERNVILTVWTDGPKIE